MPCSWNLKKAEEHLPARNRTLVQWPLFARLEPAERSLVGRETPGNEEGAMETVVFWALVAIVVLAVGYVCALNLRTRKGAFGSDPARFDAPPQIKEHGVDLQARRKTFDDVT